MTFDSDVYLQTAASNHLKYLEVLSVVVFIVFKPRNGQMLKTRASTSVLCPGETQTPPAPFPAYPPSTTLHSSCDGQWGFYH